VWPNATRAGLTGALTGGFRRDSNLTSLDDSVFAHENCLTDFRASAHNAVTEAAARGLGGSSES
jgi:hypothetical protein